MANILVVVDEKCGNSRICALTYDFFGARMFLIEYSKAVKRNSNFHEYKQKAAG